MSSFRSLRAISSAAAKANGVRHYIALSVVGTERLQASGYFVAKLAQERLIRSSGVPYTIVHSTQFFELLGFLVKAWESGSKVVVPAALIQPISSDDVADVMAEVALAAPRNGMFEIAGPERFNIRDLVAEYLAATDDARVVEASVDVPYFGAKLEEDDAGFGRQSTPRQDRFRPVVRVEGQGRLSDRHHHRPNRLFQKGIHQ